ncbi:phage tail sheath family protein [Neobacillus mesonae]|uniref:phage tail sheath family protein n=1 Tax=Neobacillus mesonae TaxID=1193713 RepID=UPI00203FD37A|nr:phage tail sheath family protein [Neobacillus mesonae]MCM3567851.1 phage tail sheath family protein [Neobacillus mesonae]
MGYEHGITIQENATSVTPPIKTSAGVQVVIGTAPIYLVENPEAAVNKPVLAYTWNEAVTAFGYSDDFEKYTLCESMFASFKLSQVAPVVFINVLDPAIHKTAVAEKDQSLTNGVGIIDDDGVLLNSVVVKSADGTKTFVRNTDYTLAFNTDNKPEITVIPTGTIGSDTNIKVAYDKLDPSKVTKTDIIGGYDAATGKYTGAELIRQVFPMYGLIPGLLLAPGWSHMPEVGLVLDAKGRKINGNFNAMNVLDVDSSTVKKYEDVETWKTDNSYTSEKSMVLWPKVKVGDKILWYSSVAAALMAYTDASNDDVPFVSPSNKRIGISATVLADGTEIYLEQTQANYLNGIGVVTAINWNGWRLWGNNTAIYPATTDPKDRFISVRRMFDWWGNTFIQSYFDKVDDPLNFRLIESLVDSENLRANGYQAKGQIAGASIEFNEELNSQEDILNGKITFIQKIAVFTPAEHIENILEFDPTILTNSIFGGE